MAISNKTSKEVIKILMKYISKEDVCCVIEDLLEVSGNKSFKDTIRKLYRETDELENS